MKKLSSSVLFRGKWLSLVSTTYQTEDGRIVEWESVERARRHMAIIIVPRLVPSQRMVLIKQFRHAIGAWVIGFPAGLTEGGDMEAEALRELKEETGYTGTITGASPMLRINSGIMDDSSQVFMAEVDETAPENLNPQQELEPSEEIEVLLVKRGELQAFLRAQKDAGAEIGPGVWMYAL